MEEKKMRELNLDEMDKISGGGGTDKKDCVEYWMKDRPCPKCGVKGSRSFKLMEHSASAANIRCLNCKIIFIVR